jgi:hypothetical protein
MNSRPVFPLPEAVDPHGTGPWGIEPSHPYTPRIFLKHRLLQVPLDDSDHARFMRDHELGHLRWSHKHPDSVSRRHKIHLDVLQAVEDARINTKLEQLAIDTGSGALPAEVATAVAKNLLRRGDMRTVVLTMVAAQGCGANQEHFRSIFEVHPQGANVIQLAEMSRKALWANGDPKFRDTIRVAKWLQLMLENVESLESLSLRRWKAAGSGATTGFDQALGIAKQHGFTRRSTTKVPWGKMKIEAPPRVRRVDGYLGRGRIASDEGTVPRNIHRQLVDGRVFQRVRRKRGGTVLIDCSGSMSLGTDDLKRILEHSPGASVAAYSGNVRDGVLRVLAAEGRQVDNQWIAAPAGGANVIDGPALQWLAKQSRPRIWVSDGQVTGVNDRMSGINALECSAVCRQRSIARCNDVAESVKVLQGIRRR